MNLTSTLEYFNFFCSYEYNAIQHEQQFYVVLQWTLISINVTCYVNVQDTTQYICTQYNTILHTNKPQNGHGVCFIQQLLL